MPRRQDRLMQLLSGNGPEDDSMLEAFTRYFLSPWQLMEGASDYPRPAQEYPPPISPWQRAQRSGMPPPGEPRFLTYTPSREEQIARYWAEYGPPPPEFGAAIPEMQPPGGGVSPSPLLTGAEAFDLGPAPSQPDPEAVKRAIFQRLLPPIVAEDARTEQYPPIPPEHLGSPLAQRATGAGAAVQPPGDAMALDLPAMLGFAPPAPEQPLSPFDEAMRNLIAMEEGLGESPMEQALARIGRLGGPAAPPRPKRVYAPYADPQAGYAQWRTAAQEQANQTYNQSMNRWAAQMQQVYGPDQANYEARREALQEARQKLIAQNADPQVISELESEAANRQHTEAQTFEVRDRVRRARDMEGLNRQIREQEVATGEINVRTAIRDYLQEPETRRLEIETQEAQLDKLRREAMISDDDQIRKQDRELGQERRNLQSDLSVRPYQTALIVLRNGLADGLIQQDEFDLYLNQITERREAQQETDRATRARERAEEARSLLDQPVEDLRRMNDINRNTKHLLYRLVDDAATDGLDEEFAQAVSGTPDVDLNNAMQQHQEALTAAVRNASQLGGSPSAMLQEYINNLSGRITNLPPAYIQKVRARIADVRNKESEYGTMLTQALEEHLIAREQAQDPDPRIRSQAADRVDAAQARLWQILMRLGQAQEETPAAPEPAGPGAAPPRAAAAAPVAGTPAAPAVPGPWAAGLSAATSPEAVARGLQNTPLWPLQVWTGLESFWNR